MTMKSGLQPDYIVLFEDMMYDRIISRPGTTVAAGKSVLPTRHSKFCQYRGEKPSESVLIVFFSIQTSMQVWDDDQQLTSALPSQPRLGMKTVEIKGRISKELIF